MHEIIFYYPKQDFKVWKLYFVLLGSSNFQGLLYLRAKTLSSFIFGLIIHISSFSNLFFPKIILPYLNLSFQVYKISIFKHFYYGFVNLDLELQLFLQLHHLYQLKEHLLPTISKLFFSLKDNVCNLKQLYQLCCEALALAQFS